MPQPVIAFPDNPPDPRILAEDDPIPESTLDKLISYVMHTPHNVNPAILIQLVRDVYNDSEIYDILNPPEPVGPAPTDDGPQQIA